MASSTLAITPGLRRKLGEWLQEDLGRGDLSAPALQGQAGDAYWQAKAPGVFCGGVLLKPLLSELVGPAGHQVELQLLVCDGASVAAGDRLLELSGPAEMLVALERTALNLASFTVVLLIAASSANADDAVKQQILKLFPQADTDNAFD